MMYKILCFILLGIVSADTVFADTADIISTILYGNTLVYSGEVSFMQEFHVYDTSTGVPAPLDDVTEESNLYTLNNGRGTITMCFYDSKVRINDESTLFDEKSQMKHLSTYNNQDSNVLVAYSLPQNNYKMNLSGTIYKENKTSSQYDLRTYTAKICRSPLEDFIAGKHDIYDLAYTRYAGTEAVNKIACAKYVAVTKDSVTCITAWLAPDYYYRPVKVVMTGDSNKEETIIDYMKYPDSELMLPHSISITRYNKVNNDYVICKTQVFDILSYKPNIEIADDAFNIDFPEGMRVFDQRVGKYAEVIINSENAKSYDYSIEDVVK